MNHIISECLLSTERKLNILVICSCVTNDPKLSGLTINVYSPSFHESVMVFLGLLLQSFSYNPKSTHF